jgi:(E)-4-hydroxy-3-methylbut-2-enyl-diphosphate synthase
MTSEKAYKIPQAFEVTISKLQLGAHYPVTIQSMANTDTNNIAESSEQLEALIKAGSQLVRFTTQGLKEVEALKQISLSLTDKCKDVPLVADVHFRAKVAFEAAKICSKVRINPGNFTEKGSDKSEYSQEEYEAGIEGDKRGFQTLISICKKYNTAIRIGVNHGSLSKRIMSRYGDTPEGMVESALEFLRVCKEDHFQNVVVSLKSSNTRLMVQSVRLLVKHMLDEDLYYPLHLGVTESGDGLEGRIKSVVGMAPLLMEGMGNTIRVSLTEPPEDELPVADQIRTLFPKPTLLPYHPLENLPWDPFSYEKLPVQEVNGVGGKNHPIVISEKGTYSDPQPDIQVSENTQDLADFIQTDLSASPEEIAAIKDPHVIILRAGTQTMTDIKAWMISYLENSGFNPIILHKKYDEEDKEKYALQASGEFGLLLIDGLLSGIWLENNHMSGSFNNWLSFYILQASRNRTTSTEFIACPSCGRTLFDIQTVLKDVRSQTNHLKGLKIAVMGCIVNGLGEMADADYGYIGSGRGTVSIYKAKKALMKNIPAENAVKSLIEAIKENGDWVDP